VNGVSARPLRVAGIMPFDTDAKEEPSSVTQLAAVLRALGLYHGGNTPAEHAAERPSVPLDRTRALTRDQIASLWRRNEVALRERAFWRLLYESAARANEILSLDIDDLDLPNKRARVRSKGGGRRVGVLGDRGGAAAAAAPGWPHHRPSLPGRSPTDTGSTEHRPVSGHRPCLVVVPPSRRTLQEDDQRADTSPASALCANPRRRGRDQHTDSARPLSARFGQVSGALRSAGSGGCRAPRRGTRPGSSPTLSMTTAASRMRPHHRSAKPGGVLTRVLTGVPVILRRARLCLARAHL